MMISLALFDYIPVGIFLVAAIILQRDLQNKMSSGVFAMFSAGTLMVFCAGFFKATWKLLYYANICDFASLNNCFMPMQATGFLLAALAMVLMLCLGKKSRALSAAAAPALFSGTMVFVSFMCIGIIAIGSVLSALAAKMKKKALIPLFVLAIVGMLGMGYLSSKDFAQVSMNWIAEGVNTFAQSMLLIGVLSLHRAGLKELKL